MEEFDIEFINEYLETHPEVLCPESPMPKRPMEDDPEVPW